MPSTAARERRSVVARPKSPSRAEPSSSSQTFAGFRSRWTTPRACACSRARQTSIAICDRALDLEPPALAVLEHAGQVAAADVLADDVGRPVLLAGVEHADDVRVLAELAHRLRLAPRAREHGLLDPLGLEDGDRDLAIAVLGIVRLVDALAAAAPEELLDRVAPDRLPVGCRLLGSLLRPLGLERRPAGVAEARFGTIDVAAGRAAHPVLRIGR